MQELSPRLVPFCSAVLLALPLGAQKPDGTSGKPAGAVAPTVGAPDAATPAGAQWQQFLQRAGGTWWSEWCPATGTPKAIYGSGLPLLDWRENSLAEARRHAEQLLQQQR